MTGIKSVLAEFKIKAKGSVFFPGATDSKIDFTNAMLKNEGLATLPYDYAMFLKETNGMIAPDTEFYGTDEIVRSGRNYKFPNLAFVNKELAMEGNPLIKGSVLVGNSSLSAIVFDAEAGAYRITNRLSFATVHMCADMAEVLRYLLGLA